MARKHEITGKVVIYTENGTQIVDAEVRRLHNAHSDTLELKRFTYPEKYLLIAMARTIPSDNIHAAQPCQKTIDTAEKYTRTKFFRLMLDLQRLAQFDPSHKDNANHVLDELLSDNDAENYRRLDFTPAMIRFTEENFNHDAVHHDED